MAECLEQDTAGLENNQQLDGGGCGDGGGINLERKPQSAQGPEA